MYRKNEVTKASIPRINMTKTNEFSLLSGFIDFALYHKIIPVIPIGKANIKFTKYDHTQQKLRNTMEQTREIKL